MMLKDQMPRQGRWLFRWRGFLPLGLAPFALLALWESRDFAERWGETAEALVIALALAVSFLGLAVRILTVGFVPGGTSGRNAQAQRAEVLNTSGIYATVRNPLYLGNFLMLLGLVIALESLWLVLLTGFAFALYYERIIYTEELFLADKFGPVYTKWAARTPAFFPRPSLWTRPALPFSLRTVLKRESYGFYLIVFVFTLLALARHVLVEGRSPETWPRENPAWLAFFLFGTVVFLLLRTLKKRTRLLRVTGR